MKTVPRKPVQEMFFWFLVFSLIILNFQGIKAKSGDSCRTPNDEEATCLPIKSCKILYNAAATTHNARQIRFIRNSLCDYDNSNYLVCCGTLDNYGELRTSDVIEPVNDLIPDRSTCGYQSANKVLGGEITDLDEFPWMVRLIYRRHRDNQTVFICGGTLISSRYVLTAAHCVTTSPTLYGVRLGEWKTDTNPDCGTLNYSNCNDPHVDVRIEGVISHADFRNNNNDIALIRMIRNVEFTDYIKPICLPKAKESSNIGYFLTVSGWGKTETTSNSKYKLKVRLPVVEQSNCNDLFRITLHNSQICVGGIRLKDSCKGDSGGPLMRTVTGNSAQWYIEGIVSYGISPCGRVNRPAVYTRVSSFLDWIRSTITI